MIPPIWINVRAGWFLIPLPVVLLWPLLAIVWVFAGLILMTVLLVTGGRATDIGKLWITSWELICALRGTRVDVEQFDRRVQILII